MYYLQKKDIELASQCLSLAFQNYPVFAYIIPDNQKREKKLKLVCKFLLNIGFSRCQLISDSDRIEAVSAWYPPNSSDIPFPVIIRSGIFSLFFNLGLKSFIRLLQIKIKKNKVRKHILKDKKYYLLDIIGVNPLFQSKGLAKSLIQSKLTETDHYQIPVYLETSEFKNVKYYQKFGFALLKSYRIKELEVFCMIRECNNLIS